MPVTFQFCTLMAGYVLLSGFEVLPKIEPAERPSHSYLNLKQCGDVEVSSPHREAAARNQSVAIVRILV